MSGGQPGAAGAQPHTPGHAKPQTGEQAPPKARSYRLSSVYQSQTAWKPFLDNFLQHPEALRQPSLLSSSVSRDRLLWSQASSGGPLPPVSTLTSLHSLSSPASSPSLIMASLPSVMSLGEPSLLIGKGTVSDLSPRLSLTKQPNALVAGLASAQPQTVPVINNVGGGFTTLQPISFQQQLHASPQQPITQHLQGHMASSPFMATMAPLPCHSTPAVRVIVSAVRVLEDHFSLILKVSLRGFRSLTPCIRCSVQQVGLASVPVVQPAVSGPGHR